jgi:hypothetical protein
MDGAESSVTFYKIIGEKNFFDLFLDSNNNKKILLNNYLYLK